MKAAVNFYLKEGLAESTRKAYNTGQHRYLRFCQLIDLQPVSALEHQLMLFSPYLAMQGLKWRTIKAYLSAVCHLHLMGAPQGGFSDLARPRLQLLLRGIRRSTSAIPKRTRLPITPLILHQVWQACPVPATDHNAMMIWAAMATCFFRVPSGRRGMLSIGIRLGPHVALMCQRSGTGQPLGSYQTVHHH